ncbi:MAG: DUF881 domain-containing protein [Thermoleophilia bacterium]
MAPTRNHYLIITVFTFLLGILATLAYRGNEALSQPTGAEERHAQLVAVVEQLEEKRTELETSLAELREEAAAYEQEAATRRGLSRTYADQLADLRMLAGLVPVQGPGVKVTLADNPQPPESGDPNNFIIHDYDVRILVNALWSGGAEAVSVNGQRIVTTSAIRCVGTTILVNNTRLGSPFEILAVGDADALLRALESNEDAALLVQDYARMFGLRVEVSPEDRLLLPAYAGSITPRELTYETETETVPAGTDAEVTAR